MSIGVAEITAEMDNIDDLFRKADLALYEDKNRGRDLPP
jgi:PleD family two-component response regulator